MASQHESLLAADRVPDPSGSVGPRANDPHALGIPLGAIDLDAMPEEQPERPTSMHQSPTQGVGRLGSVRLVGGLYGEQQGELLILIELGRGSDGQLPGAGYGRPGLGFGLRGRAHMGLIDGDCLGGGPFPRLGDGPRAGRLGVRLSRCTHVPLGHGLVPLAPGEGAQPDGDEKACQNDSHGHPLTPDGGATGGEQVLRLQPGWFQLLVGRTGQPLLTAVEVSPAQQVATLAVVPLPLQRPHLQAGMLLDPGVIGLDRMDQVSQNLAEIVLVAEEEPVQGGQLWSDLLRLHLPYHNRNEAFVVLGGVGDLQTTDL